MTGMMMVFTVVIAHEDYPLFRKILYPCTVFWQEVKKILITKKHLI
ncbi:hypothetical protein pah_c045o095 [Parachlamydia acanthamoebae str. Hall's coccus]|nr:hypothetical protein pah_c045o095 [Parachlamydia acanthamoebae str. Hall's coccus]